MDSSTRINVKGFMKDKCTSIDEKVVQEKQTILKHNNEVIAVLQTSPGHERALAIGHCLSLGLQPDLTGIDLIDSDIVNISGVTELETTKGPKIQVSLEPSFLYETAALLRQSQPLHEQTGGAHGALVRTLSGDSYVVAEDVGRQNAIDKVIGLSYEEMDITNALLLLSGRLTLEVVTKAVNSGYPVLASFAVATAQGIEFARKHGLTLVGGLKENRFWLYNEGRVRITTENDSS